MNLSRMLSAALLLALTGCISNGPAPSSEAGLVAQIDAALKLVADRELAQAEGVIQPVIHAKRFDRLSSAEQYRALTTAAKLAYTLKEPKLEYESRVRLLELPEATAADRMSRLNAANRLKDTHEIIVSLTDVVRKDPANLDHLNYRFILRQLDDAKKALPHGATLPLMQALYAARWKLRWDVDPSATWRDYALLLLEQNRLPEAIDVSSRVWDEYVLISMRADRRFDAITAANPAQFDVEAASKRDVEHFQAVAEGTPKALLPKTIVIGGLMEQQHYGAALAAVDGVVAEIRMRSDPKQWYEDFDDQYAWILNERSRALQRVGRWDEGIDQLAAASYVPDEDGKNVSQVINLGDLYCNLGKPREALDVLVRLGSAISAYGRMQEVYVRFDAAVQLRDTEQTQRWFGFIREHRADAPRTYEDALLRMNDMDGAAKWLIERLEDSDGRSATLLNIQDYAVPALTPRQAELNKLKKELVARADVQAVLAKVGRIESYKIEGLGE